MKKAKYLIISFAEDLYFYIMELKRKSYIYKNVNNTISLFSDVPAVIIKGIENIADTILNIQTTTKAKRKYILNSRKIKFTIFNLIIKDYIYPHLNDLFPQFVRKQV